MSELDTGSMNEIIARFQGWRKIQNSADYTGVRVGLDPERHPKYAHQKTPIPRYTSDINLLFPIAEKLMLERLAACGYSKVLDAEKNIIEYVPVIEWVGKDPEVFPELRQGKPAKAMAVSVTKVIMAYKL